MSKKNKKSRKSKVTLLTKLRSLSKKTVITALSVFCGIVLITTAVITVRTINKRRADRTVRIAFYGLSEEQINMLKGKIPEEENIILEYKIISDDDFDPAVIKAKCDMLFTWKGEVTDILSASAEDLPKRVLETMPSSLRNQKCLPIILDNCELSFSKQVLENLNSDVPSSFDTLQDFLNSAKGLVFSPYYCNGGDDRIFIDFIGALVMAKGGLSAYNKLIDELRKAEKFEDVIDIKLDEKDCSLRALLDMLKNWPVEGLTHPSWFNGRGNDLLYFAEDKQLGCFFTLLSEHRKMPYNVVKNYETSFFPTNHSAINYGVIAPALSVMLFSDNSNSKRYIYNFFTEEAQEEFSDATGLAPVHSHVQAYDLQADNVRYWAASCKGGAVPDLYLAVYQRKPEALKNLCNEIRNYLR